MTGGKEENEVRILIPWDPFMQGFPSLISSLRATHFSPRQVFPQSSLLLQVPVTISSSSLPNLGLVAVTLFPVPGQVTASCRFPTLFHSFVINALLNPSLIILFEYNLFPTRTLPAIVPFIICLSKNFKSHQQLPLFLLVNI